jgi:uncharacterized membrane protein
MRPPQPDDNPFERPREVPADRPAAAAGGKIDLGAALQVAWEALGPNIGSWIGVGVVGFLIAFVSGITVLGIFIVWPVLYWGWVNYTLKAAAGEARLGDFFEGFSRYGSALLPMLGLFGINVALGLASQTVSFAAPFVGSELRPVVSGIGFLINLAFTIFVSLRFWLSHFYVVDQGLGALDAMAASWRATAGQTLQLVILGLLCFALVIAGFLALGVGIIPATLVLSVLLAEVYRQVVGAPPAVGSRV